MSDSILDLSASSIILRMKPNWADDPTRSISMNRDEYQYSESPVSLVNISDYLIHIVEYSFTFTNHSDYYTFVKFFNDRQGRLKRFWLPVYRNEFTLSNDISDLDTTITVVDSGFADIYQGYEILYIELKNGNILTRKITGVTDNGDGTETFQLESLMDRNILSSEIKYLSRILLVRFDSDDLPMTHSSDTIAEVSIIFRELVREYESTGGSS
jgi:hypothetical protein